ncbi:MAG: 30S ribosome-binding factor RbfA [Brevinematales bacterium]|nr:30S ribosome-binding factor RbfA [Brevinematales bacterium]
MSNKIRMQRLNKTLIKEVSQAVCSEVKDPRLLSMVTVLDCELSKDMHYMKVEVSLYSSNEVHNIKTLAALNNAGGFISSVVSKNLRLKFAPTIEFKRSHMIEDSVRITNKMKEITGDDSVDESQPE